MRRVDKRATPARLNGDKGVHHADVEALCLSLLALLALGAPAPAQDFPTRPVTIIVPLTSAGAPDILARVIAKNLQERHAGSSFLVENRAGGGTTIGSNTVAKAPPGPTSH